MIILSINSLIQQIFMESQFPISLDLWGQDGEPGSQSALLKTQWGSHAPPPPWAAYNGVREQNRSEAIRKQLSVKLYAFALPRGFSEGEAAYVVMEDVILAGRWSGFGEAEQSGWRRM